MKEMLKRTEVYDFTSVQFLFEALGNIAFYLIKANSENKSAFESILINYFMDALKSKSDLLNFCLQILSIFLQLESSTNPQYVAIYSSLLMPENWKE